MSLRDLPTFYVSYKKLEEGVLADELSELVDSPVELLHVEYKAWLDLEQIKARADLARHIAAISNYGGGKIVFGIADNGTSCGPPPSGFKLDHDTVASIVKKYLDPAVHCDVRWTKSKLGVAHAVIVVPPHGATPICAKANGPESSKGKIEGIVAGAYYLRKPGPESAQIVTAADWRDVVRRCALHDRSAIFAALTAALSSGSDDPARENPKHMLEHWAKAADAEYLRRLGDRELEVPLRDCRIQLSYFVESASPEELPSDRFVDVLREVGYEVQRHVVTGWSLFHVFDAVSLSPRWASDPSAPVDEFMQSSLLEEGRTLGFDLWRISKSGLVTTIREYWEDTPDFRLGARVALNPKILTRMLGELVWHAASFSSRFASPVRVYFRCEWRGLAGRSLVVPNGLPFRTRAAEVDRVLTEGVWPVTALSTEVAEIVSNLSGKVARALDLDDLSASRITDDMRRWRNP
jgi:hypothetical protein